MRLAGENAVNVQGASIHFQIMRGLARIKTGIGEQINAQPISLDLGLPDQPSVAPKIAQQPAIYPRFGQPFLMAEDHMGQFMGNKGCKVIIGREKVYQRRVDLDRCAIGRGVERSGNPDFGMARTRILHIGRDR